MTDFNAARVRFLNDRPLQPDGRYVLYWCQMFRRLRANHALGHARKLALELNKPLVIYEGLKRNYPWANARLHTFILEGMRDNHAAATQAGANYWPFVETPGDSGRGLVRKLCEPACVLVTDDYPQFIIPAHNRAIGQAVRIAAMAVDGNSVVPLAKLGPPTAAAAHLRPKIHKLFLSAWEHRADPAPEFASLARLKLAAPFPLWEPPADVAAFVRTLPVDASVPPVPGVVGGSQAAARVLETFVKTKLPNYADTRSRPDDPDVNAASRLSPYLHYGHISIQEVVEKVLATVKWTPSSINPKTRNKDDFYCRDANVNGYLDEAVTWRDVGYQWHYAHQRAAEQAAPSTTQSWAENASKTPPSFNFETFDFSPISSESTLNRVLPGWAYATLAHHAADPRPHTYTLEQFESAQTHDPLWNAAQKELVATGRIHNYLRMLWGKKVLQWTPDPETAYQILEHLNNKYALDGRDPNSYCGILWTFGLFDRPWPPNRPIFGNVRYMTSESTAKKFRLQGYLDWVKRLPSIEAVRAGQTVSAAPAGLFE